MERACGLLGVSRLVAFDHRDSGMPGWADNTHPAALVQADIPALARRLADLCLEEGAEILVHYDGDGIYRHPDHLAVHRIGTAAAALAGIAAYESTVDLNRAVAGPGHLVDTAAGGARVGRSANEICSCPAILRRGGQEDAAGTASRNGATAIPITLASTGSPTLNPSSTIDKASAGEIASATFRIL